MAGDPQDGHLLPHPPGARGGLGGLLELPAEQVQGVGGERGPAEALAQVDHRGVAVAERALRARLAAGQLHRGGHEVGVQRLQVGLARHPPQLGGRPVGTRALEQVVVHLHDDPAAGLEAGAVAVAGRPLVAAGRPGGQPVGVGEPGEVALQAAPAEAGPPGVDRLGVELLGRRDLVGVDLEQDDVVHDVGVARQHLAAGEPDVLVELGVEEEAAVVVGADPAGRTGGVVGVHLQRHPLLTPAQGDLLAGLHRGELLGGHLGRGRRLEDVGGLTGTPVLPRLQQRDRRRADHGQHRGDQDRQETPAHPAAHPAAHPGGQVRSRPASTCRWVWKTVWPAFAPVLNTRR